MRISVVGINFFPERVGIGVYTHDMCRFFVEAGHDVSVVTGFPYYPELRLERRYEGRWFVTERLDGMTVHRCGAYLPERWSVRGRIIQEVSFALSAVPRLFALGKSDVLVVISPPFVPAVAAALAGYARRIPVAVHVQDLQPDAASQLGMIRNRAVLRSLYLAEKNLYRCATLISSLNDIMCRCIVEKGVPREKVVTFPNWVDIEFTHLPLASQGFRRQYGFGEEFLLVYSGSMGVKQGLDLILDVAGAASTDPSVRFVLIGDGAAREELQRKALVQGLTNVTFLPLQPLEVFPAVVAASDISLVPQQPAVRDVVVPSKVLRLMAGGSPILAVAHPDSGLARVLRESEAGIVISKYDPIAVWDAAKELQSNPGLRQRMAERGRIYVARHFARHVVLGRYLRRLEGLPRGELGALVQGGDAPLPS